MTTVRSLLSLRHLLSSLFLVLTTWVSLVTDMRTSNVHMTSTKPVKITTVLIEPYVMAHYPHGNRSKEVTYFGFVPDLVRRLSQVAGFDYTIRLARDGKYGHRRSDGSWDGMIGEVMSSEADMAVSPMFVTEYRSRVVDFTRPFLAVEATMLLRKPPNGHDSHIKSITDLLNQSEIKYGTLDTGLLLWSFKNTNDSMCKIMWRNMQRFKPSVFTSTNEEGIRRVRREKYAFILPSTIGEYIARQSPCDLMTVDRFLMERGYGVALPKGSPFLPQLNRALRRLKQSGFLDRLYHKWWLERNDCPDGVQSSKIYSVNTARRTSHGVLPIVIFLIFVQT